MNFARDAGLDLSVKGGGHSAPGFGTNDGGVVIDLSLMRHVHVDPVAHARTGGGATWGDFNYATHAYGLATTGGDHLHYRRRRAHPGRRHRLPGPGLRAEHRQPAVRRGGHRRRSGAQRPAPTRTRTCSGRCGAAAATSASSPRSSSRCTPSNDVYVGLFFYELDHAGTLLRFYPGLHQGRPRGLRLRSRRSRSPRRLPFIPRRPPRRHLLRWPWCTGRGRSIRARTP